MSNDSSDDDGLLGLPSLETEDGRDMWAEILLQQDDETLALGDLEWIKTLVVMDEDDNMVIRLIYGDGTEEVLDAKVRRTIAVVNRQADLQN